MTTSGSVFALKNVFAKLDVEGGFTVLFACAAACFTTFGARVTSTSLLTGFDRAGTKRAMFVRPPDASGGTGSELMDVDAL